MKCSVYIATSVDGYIATPEGAVDWLHSAGNLETDMGDDLDMGFGSFIESVDCMVMGRKCMDMISSMNLSLEQWPYGDIHIAVLSNTVRTPPENLKGKVEMFSGKITDLVKTLESKGFKHAYIDGGSTITSFLNHRLIDEMIITRAPVLLGEGIPLFGKLDNQIRLVNSEAKAFANDFIQIKYRVNYL
ncbi:MAG: dihydrofolate reductase family protein [Candidatus Thiodiazotropha lotti]|uniref:Dihydrofolate reductase family protein n=1 Tax=Candidatus Thiodiazotropha lotti TaxID=2792787 RepID=A0A9E4N0U9_9GAMM|nr:dihydrofolate reductase family protein [Candidatus Thiodiazotropha lotti]ODC01009.1 dihydrofolate reductase [Candidatus Thiodiazotropha endoloripes]MCG7920730.1 dihydrofolate reductase family protein [Candidatus Thiodiazotropha lotti]MCG7929880.1 dihydrofolate reductase family protein [Candidatus Thiodiazotropha lotti]MCG7940952.1 dihydrofolate reductase family protein [Candidatus Thiodiazotropha lotti]